MAKKELSGTRDERLAKARIEMAKRFGAGAIIDPRSAQAVETIPTGLIMLDAALGCGGLPRGRTVELFGAESSGKSTISLSLANQFLQRGEAVLYLDYEHSFSPDYAALFGIDYTNPLFNWSQPTSAEEGVEQVKFYLENKLIGLAIFDSLAAMPTQKELDADVDDVLVAPLARFMSVQCRVLNPLADTSGAMIVFINHVHETIGGYGPPSKTTPGGRGLKFYSSVRIETARTGNILGRAIDLKTGKKAEKDQQIGTRHEARVIKNKIAPPGKRGQFVIRDGYGLCEPQIVVEAAESRGFISRSGAYYTLAMSDERFQGLDSLLDYLRGHGDAYQMLRTRVAESFATPASLAISAEEGDATDGDDAVKSNVLKLSQAERL